MTDFFFSVMCGNTAFPPPSSVVSEKPSSFKRFRSHVSS